jgi:hypothetical protein
MDDETVFATLPNVRTLNRSIAIWKSDIPVVHANELLLTQPFTEGA